MLIWKAKKKKQNKTKKKKKKKKRFQNTHAVEPVRDIVLYIVADSLQWWWIAIFNLQTIYAKYYFPFYPS